MLENAHVACWSFAEAGFENNEQPRCGCSDRMPTNQMDIFDRETRICMRVKNFKSRDALPPCVRRPADCVFRFEWKTFGGQADLSAHPAPLLRRWLFRGPRGVVPVALQKPKKTNQMGGGGGGTWSSALPEQANIKQANGTRQSSTVVVVLISKIEYILDFLGLSIPNH